MKLEYDIIVVGGGHAGCEAAAAAAKLGAETLVITMDLTKFAQMSCNPAVGGVAKGQIVREIDALGGQMGIITDRSTIQFRMLNKSKGAAMWSPRAQCDKGYFSQLWRQTLENIPGLYLWQDSVTEVLVEKRETGVGMTGDLTGEKYDQGGNFFEKVSSDQVADTPTPLRNMRAVGVKTTFGIEFRAKAVILTTGTFLNGLMHIGRSQAPGGRSGDAASYGLTESLVGLGFENGRMKTGTPARLDGRTIDFSKLEKQDGDEQPSRFSFLPESASDLPQKPCYLTQTTTEVHETLRTGFGDSPLFTGIIKGLGPRYCPSIEDKLRTFADKDSHHLFLEPEGASTHEYYLNGFSSSLPWNIQFKALQKVPGLEQVQLYRPGYAIEYDYFPPTQLDHSLQTKRVGNLYFAGQINGTTGYEEAGAQGLMAGINAVLTLRGREPLVLRRDQAYIGVLIDDLVTKGVDEPYRMFTSRAEYRILLRQDNADLRLTEIGRQIGLVDDHRYAIFVEKKSLSESLISFINELSVAPHELDDYLFSADSPPLPQSRKLYSVLLREGITIQGLASELPALQEFIDSHAITRQVIEQAEIQIKYKGYIERERMLADKLMRLEDIRIHDNFDFNALGALSIESRQKLTRIRPKTIGQASRIPGVSPADINVLLLFFGR